MTTVNTKTYFNMPRAVKNEENFNLILEGQTGLTPATKTFDFMIDSDVVVTGLEVTKTVLPLPDGALVGNFTSGKLVVSVQKIPAGPLATGTAVDISKVTLGGAEAAGVAVGVRAIAGFISPAGGPATADSFAFDATGSTPTDPVQKIVASSGVTAPTQQRMRISVVPTQSEVGAPATNGSFSCAIKVSLQRIRNTKSSPDGVIVFNAATDVA